LRAGNFLVHTLEDEPGVRPTGHCRRA